MYLKLSQEKKNLEEASITTEVEVMVTTIIEAEAMVTTVAEAEIVGKNMKRLLAAFFIEYISVKPLF